MRTIVVTALDGGTLHSKDTRSHGRIRKLGGLESEALSHGTAELSAKIGVSRNTARDWRREHRIPSMWWRAVRALVLGDLGVLSEAWRGWRITGGRLHAPDGGAFVFSPGEICAIRFRPPPEAEHIIGQLQDEICRLRRQLRDSEAFNPEHPRQADWITRRFDPAPEPARSLEERFAAATAQVERLEHTQRMRASEPRPWR